MFFNRAKYLNSIYPIIHDLIEEAGIEKMNSFMLEVKKELVENKQPLPSPFSFRLLVFEVISEVVWAEKNYLWKESGLDAEQAAIFSVSLFISQKADTGSFEEIKKEQPEMYEALERLWMLCGTYIDKDFERFGKAVITPKKGNPFN